MFGEDDALEPVTRSSFYNWRTDEASIRDAMSWPYDGLLFDVEQNDLWRQPRRTLERTAEPDTARTRSARRDGAGSQAGAPIGKTSTTRAWLVVRAGADFERVT